MAMGFKRVRWFFWRLWRWVTRGEVDHNSTGFKMNDIPFPQNMTKASIHRARVKARPKKERKIKRRQRDIDAEYFARLRNGKTIEKGGGE